MKNSPLNGTIHEIKIPEFRNFLTNPHNPCCKILDSTRLMVEILGGIQHAEGEFSDGSFGNSLLIDGRYALVVRYKREKEEKYRPTCALSWEVENEKIIIKQLQGSRDKHIAYRFHSTFQGVPFFLKILEQTFFQKGIPVHLEQFPTGVENGAHNSKAFSRYDELAEGLRRLGEKYYHNLQTEQK